ncbi:DUF4910 domain-containing protein [Roseomonas sp. NAR14]|uniref:DUF4910 domain-containing protein n=1 Tax=Roseomonas acroporae TaxID=2937791 RepID=A0A9X2BWX1_9PROT|nr:DUF4910 domain-containing protein [Roseomonas acroporae]MCK8784350.1 DUF4910 domain-containing protein [Roseomonas acroporae]
MNFDPNGIGQKLHRHVSALFPIFRSITGEGMRQTLAYIGESIPLQIRQVPTGTPVLDWEVPQEWTVRGATLRRLNGDVVLDIADTNLHLVHYSHPVDRVVPIEELQAHLHSLPKQPDLVPYRTAYYANSWGFCLAERQRQALTDPAYHVSIDTELAPGVLNYGEMVLPGEGPDEVLFSIHCCHPSLANDNLSSIAIAIELAQRLERRARRRFTYRFLFAPGTIGAITWLHLNREVTARIRHGLVLSCLGDGGPPTYKRSRRENADIDRYVAYQLRAGGHGDRVRPFLPYGYDERQYCSPGFDLPVGCLTRTPNGEYPEYHTSADDLELVRPEALADSLALLCRLVDMIEADYVPLGTCLHGEPQLGRRGLYQAIGGQPIGADPSSRFDQLTLLWVINQADGTHSLLDIAERSGKPFAAVAAAAEALAAAGLLNRADPSPARASDRQAGDR